MRPGMYIGKLGDGSSHDDGIYILLKEVLDNSIDEFVMGAGKTIEVSVQSSKVTVRDYGRGIPLGKIIDVVSKMNTGGKYDTRAFKKAVGLNGVGTKAVNALSNYFKVESNRDGKTAYAEFNKGELDFELTPKTVEPPFLKCPIAMLRADITGFLFNDAMATDALSIILLITISIESLFNLALSLAISAIFQASCFFFGRLTFDGYTLTVCKNKITPNLWFCFNS